jgi:hypothetical protein
MDAMQLQQNKQQQQQQQPSSLECGGTAAPH